MSNTKEENSRPSKVSVDSAIDVKSLVKNMEKKLGDIYPERERKIRDENIKRNDHERRKQSLLKRLRKRRPAGQSFQSKVNNGNEMKELKPILSYEPAPVPPKKSKDVLYSKMENIELFKDIEDVAINEVSENVTFAVLMNNLLVCELTELERVRILFHWITSQNLNAIKFPHNLLEDSPYGHLKEIHEDKSTYSVLFQRLCRAAGLHCKTVRGYKKSVEYFPDHSFQKNPSEFVGSWNAVYVDGEWRLIDTYWAARYFKGQSAHDKMVYKCNEHYFLTDPDKLITSHFPEDPKWQLLHRPKTLEQFEEDVQNWPSFYDFKLSHVSHNKGLVAIDFKGHVQIRLEVPPQGDYQFRFKLQPRYEHEVEEHVVGAAVQEYSKAVFPVFPPTHIDYILTLYGMRTGEKVLNALCTYQLQWPKKEHNSFHLVFVSN